MSTKDKNIRELSRDELIKRENDLRKELLLARISHTNQQLKNPLKLREIKKEIARVLTIIKEKGAQ